MKRLVIFILLIVLTSLVSADTVVEFIDGSLEIKKGSVWIALTPGDSIPGGAVIRVGANSIVELSDRNTKFSLTNPGIYHIDSIVLNSTRSTKAKSLIFDTIRRMFGYQILGQSSSQTTVLGVRAAKVPDDGFSWNNDEYAEYLDAGKDYLFQGNYAEAKYSFTDAMDVSFDDFEEEEALFYLAYVEALSGNSSGALGLIFDYSPDSDAPYYEQAVLLKANLLIESFAANEAISWIRLHETQAPGITESLILLEGLANLQLGNIGKARDLFNQVVEYNTGSESVEIAKEYLKSL